MSKKALSESDICAKYITPAIIQAGWDETLQIRREVFFTKGRIIVRGKLVTRGKAKRADYILYYQHFPIALIEAKDNNHAVSKLFEDGIHLLIQTGDVARSQGVIQTYTSKYNDVGLAQSMKWPTGTLCITIAANIADSGILSFDACFPDSVVGFFPASMFQSARYFEYFVRTAKANLLEFAPATAQKNINLEILNAVLIPLPPLAEQHRIVTKVDELMALCDQLEAKINTTEADSRCLLEAVLHEALAPALEEAA
jgi:hypothetical protein